MSELHRLPIAGSNLERATEQAKRILEAIQDAGEAGFEAQLEAAWRSARGRSRWIVAGRSRPELLSSLAEFILEGRFVASGQQQTGPRRPTFVFSGMGPQWPGMGRGMAEALPNFAGAIHDIDTLLAEHCGLSVWDELSRYEVDDQVPTALAQPGNFLLQAALHDYLALEGITPAAVVGHSAGEVAAAYAAGVYTLPEAARVAVVRGRLQATLAGRGAMLAIGLGLEEAEAAIADLDCVSIAAVNDHQAVTVSGDQSQILQLEERMRAQAVFAKVLRVEVPYHSPVMDEIAESLESELSFLRPTTAKVPLYSTVTGQLSTGEEWGADYWVRNVRMPVRFADAIEQALADASKSFIEFAPHPVLTPSITSLTPRDEGVSVTPLLSRRGDEFSAFLQALGNLALEGLGRQPRGQSAQLVTPERHPQLLWDQDRWYEEDRRATPAVEGLPLLGRRVPDHPDQYEVELSLSDLPWVEGHQVQSLGPVVPATMWADLMGLAVSGGDLKSVSLLNLTILQGLPVLTNPTRLRTEVRGGMVHCYSRPVGDTSSWTLNAVATVGPSVPHQGGAIANVDGPSTFPLDQSSLYALFRLKGLHYTGPFRNLDDVRLTPRAGRCLPDEKALVAWGTVDGGPEYTDGQRAPWVLDAGLQLMIAAARELGEAMYLPYRLGQVIMRTAMPGKTIYRARAEVTHRTAHEIIGSVQFYDESGAEAAQLVDVVCLRNKSDDTTRAIHMDRNTYALRAVTPKEVAERFTPESDDDEIVGRTSDDLDAQFDDPEVGNNEYWLSSGLPVDPDNGRSIVTLAEVPRGEAAHLLWSVPNRNRNQDAQATFDLVNQVAALSDPTITLTLVGAPEQTWLLGLRRSATNAFGFPVRAILAADDLELAAIDPWIATADEYEIRLQDEAYLSRLERVDRTDVQTVVGPVIDDSATAVFDLPTPARLETTIEPVPPPGPGQITIENQAVPLAWKDVGKAFGAIGAATIGTFAGNDLGLGAVGRVLDAGSGVPLKVGDLVAGPVRRPFRRRMTVDVAGEFIRPVSPEMDPATQLALMMPWVTTLAALDDVARIRSGRIVFVQSGAGALGSVLCQHALALGCRVVTSVGTEDKVDVISKWYDGRVDVVVARGDDIPGRLMAAGFGPYDVVVATVNGSARSLLLEQLRVGGCFLDLGKPSGPDELQPTGAIDGNRTLARIDTDQIATQDPVWFDDLITRALAKVNDPANRASVTRYPIEELPRAIADLAKGETVGSLVVDLDERLPTDQPLRSVPTIHSNGVYLITGGYGGVGLMCAQWLASRGAGTIVVTGRSGQPGEQGRASIDLLTAFGAQIWAFEADVTDQERTRELMRELRADGPLRGVIHAAGVVADGPFSEIDCDRTEQSFGPKLDGADNLVAALDELEGAWEDLDFFLMTSSMSGALGVSLQATYAAANTGLDGLAESLRNRGVHATAMQLGPIAEGGMAANDERNERFFAANGLSMVTPRQLFGVLDLAATTSAPVLMTAEVDWKRVGRSEPGNAKSSVIGHIVSDAIGDGGQAGLEELLALDRQDRADVLTIALLGLFSEALGVDDGALERDLSFADMGIDSLAVVEIQVGVSEILQHEVPMARLFVPDGNIGQLAGRMAEYLDEVVVSNDELLAAPHDAEVGG